MEWTMKEWNFTPLANTPTPPSILLLETELKHGKLLYTLVKKKKSKIICFSDAVIETNTTAKQRQGMKPTNIF